MSSLLFKLPIELRLDIYKRVLHREEGLKVRLDESKPIESDPLAIRSTCKQIYEETDGVVFAANDTWRFEYSDIRDERMQRCRDERLQRWCEQAGDRCLNRARAIELDLGTYVIGQPQEPDEDLDEDDPLNAPASWATERAIELYPQLPKPLKRLEVKTTLHMRLDWTDGMTLIDGSTQHFEPFKLSSTLWQAPKVIGTENDQALSEYCDDARQFFRSWRNSWRDGDSDLDVLSFSNPQSYNREGPRIYKEMRELETAVEVITNRFAEFFNHKAKGWPM